MKRLVRALAIATLLLPAACSSGFPSAGALSTAVVTSTSAPADTRTLDVTTMAGSRQTQTAAPIFTSIAGTETNIALTPSQTSSPTFTSSVMPTQAPVPVWLTPIATTLASEPKSDADALTIRVLKISSGYYRGFPLYQDIGNIIGIKIVQDALNPQWLKTDDLPNGDKTLTVFLSYAPEPTPNPVATMTMNT